MAIHSSQNSLLLILAVRCADPAPLSHQATSLGFQTSMPKAHAQCGRAVPRMRTCNAEAHNYVVGGVYTIRQKS